MLCNRGCTDQIQGSMPLEMSQNIPSRYIPPHPSVSKGHSSPEVPCHLSTPMGMFSYPRAPQLAQNTTELGSFQATQSSAQQKGPQPHHGCIKMSWFQTSSHPNPTLALLSFIRIIPKISGAEIVPLLHQSFLAHSQAKVMDIWEHSVAS